MYMQSVSANVFDFAGSNFFFFVRYRWNFKVVQITDRQKDRQTDSDAT